MCRKIAAAKRASKYLMICARTDAGAISVDEAIRRAKAYGDAGADIIFVEAPTDVADIKRIREEINIPLLGNMTEFGRTPFISASEWEQFHYELVIFPVSALRVSARALEDFYRSLRANGDVSAHIDAMMTRRELYEVIKYFDYEALDDKIVKSVLPGDQMHKSPQDGDRG
jgi:methylisocitrate lyase